MKTKVFIDFDKTLFDAKEFKRRLFEIFRKAGFSDDEIETTYRAEYMDYKYSPERHMERLEKLRGYNKKLTQSRLDHLYSEVPKLIFYDVENFLGGIDREKYELVLFTLGYEPFQRRKVELSRVEKYFDESLFVEDQKWNIMGKHVEEGDFFIVLDDRVDALENIKKKFPKAVVVFVDRYSKDDEGSGSGYGGPTVESLKEAMKYVS